MMKIRWSDAPFLLQVGIAVLMAGAQTHRMLTTLEGVSLSMFLSFELFLIINLLLAGTSHRTKPDRGTSQTLWIYRVWIALLTMNIATVAWHGGYSWSVEDTLTACGVGGLSALIAVTSRTTLGKVDLAHDWVRAALGVVFKALPQLLFGMKVDAEGGGGTPAVAIFAGHVTVSIRLYMIVRSIIRAPRDRSRWALLVSEGANELSWIAVTAIWWRKMM